MGPGRPLQAKPSRLGAQVWRLFNPMGLDPHASSFPHCPTCGTASKTLIARALLAVGCAASAGSPTGWWGASCAARRAKRAEAAAGACIADEFGRGRESGGGPVGGGGCGVSGRDLRVIEPGGRRVTGHPGRHSAPRQPGRSRARVQLANP